MRTLPARAAGALLAVLVLAAPAVGRERKKPSEMYAEKEAAFMRAIAAKFVELGDEAKKMKLYQFAREAYEQAISYETHNRKARKILGYERRGGEWALNPVEAKKFPEKNQRPQNMLDSEFERILKGFEEKKAKVGLYAGKKYAGLGRWCAKAGLDDQARKAFEKGVRLDPDNEVARKGLGYAKVDGKWLTAKQLRALKEAREGRLVNDTPSRFEGPLGLKLNKMESAHFRIETVFAAEALRDYIRNCETAYAYFLRDVGEDEIRDVWSQKSLLLVLATKVQWHKYVDTFGPSSPKRREFTKKCMGSQDAGSVSGTQYQGEKGDHSSTIDGLVHKTTHFLVAHYWKIHQAWLSEGFAYYYTVKVLESTRTHCVNLGSYESPGGGFKDWGQSDNWKDLVKGEVMGNSDPDLRIFYGMNTATIPFNASVKAWSLISWLFDKHREKFLKWLAAVGREGKKQEAAFQEFFGWSFEDVDKNWREYVRENY